MTRIALSRLGPAARAQAEALLAAGAGTPVKSKSKGDRAERWAQPCPGHCRVEGCGEAFANYAAFDRHAREEHGGRAAHWEIDLVDLEAQEIRW